MKILVVANSSAEIVARKRLLECLINDGHSIYVVSNIDDRDISVLDRLSILYSSVQISPRTKNPFADIMLYVSYKNICKKILPDLILGYHIKPNIYCGIAAKRLKIPFIANITGLGRSFDSNSFLQKLVVCLYRFAFANPKCFVFFQNKDDKAYFIDKQIITKDICCDILPGSGVDINFFNPSIFTNKETKNVIEFSYIGRLVINKGIRIFIEAAKIISEQHKNCRFNIAGSTIIGDSDFLQTAELEEACKNKSIIYHGEISDVRAFLHEHTDCIIFPSFYREGVPRCLLESAAMAKPMIVTDSIGTREPCCDGINGYLVKKSNINDLVDKINLFLSLDRSVRDEMGIASRKIAEQRFSDTIVIEKYLTKISEIQKLSL